MQSEIAVEEQTEQEQEQEQEQQEGQVTETVRPRVSLPQRVPNHAERRAWRLAMKTKMPATRYACARCGRAFVGPLGWTCRCPVLKPRRAGGNEE